MEQKYLNDDVFEQINDFIHSWLTEEQKLLVDKLILNKELKERYEKYGLCQGCKQPRTGTSWCQSCNVKRFQPNFKNWTSGNSDVDKFIQESQLSAKTGWEKLEWIEYDKIRNIEYIAQGGFGRIYKAFWKEGYISSLDYETNQWVKSEHKDVALKSLNDSEDITIEFLNEIKSHLKMNNSERIIKLYGITKDPKSGNFMMVMQYSKQGDLRHSLVFDLQYKLFILSEIAHGLSDIHKEGLIHRDFHCGNILDTEIYYSVTDLGLCKPASDKNDKKVYGVLPYVAPEVLRGKQYTQESDVYSFGIIIYELINGLFPYYDMEHEEFLAIKICQGLRPSFNIKVPQLIDDIVKQCVDADPSKRPTAEYLYKNFYQWYWDSRENKNSEIYKQIQEADKCNENQSSINIKHDMRPHTSRLLDFNNLPEPKNADDKDDEGDNNKEEYSESTRIDFTKFNFQD